jgi:hypothetical protein
VQVVAPVARVRHDDPVKPRIWATAAAVWAAFYVGLYIAIVHGKHGGVFVVYAFLVIAAGLLVLPTGVLGPSLARTNLMMVGLVLFVLAALWAAIGAAGFGLLLLPAIVATVRAVSKISRAAPPPQRPAANRGR